MTSFRTELETVWVNDHTNQTVIPLDEDAINQIVSLVDGLIPEKKVEGSYFDSDAFYFDKGFDNAIDTIRQKLKGEGIVSKAKIEMIPQIVVPPRDESTCEHVWSWHTYVLGASVITKKLCFYCKKVEDV